ncbi:MAG: pyridoxamine 5'-phosphate oxidase family protein [Oscillospiraceae bacterium]|jgi:nitroimidazol reductase NimA-like FMN-containing flavoprotein (pyridoxamine 5'-phosphate oxidase superfamily)|nr:pyridoxamine 5'-phosphate oxidase family protein [Oscillospiraceae bacterium]MCI2034341.1 pyridoxamine 5'-phosphate oxidase family protein [Oscillospiraceae bacterium]
MRRSDREVKEFDEIVAILGRCSVVRLALCDGDRPYVVPLNFGYRAENGRLTLYFHSAPQGRKLDLIRKNPNACFEADGSFRLATGPDACDWSADYESVVGAGRASVLEDPEEIRGALDLIMKKYGFPGKPEYRPEYLLHMAVIRLDVTALTGKRHRKG